MNNLMLLLLAALALSCSPAICAEASDQDHEEGLSKRSPAAISSPRTPVIRSESPAGSVSTTSSSDSTPAATSNPAVGESGTAPNNPTPAGTAQSTLSAAVSTQAVTTPTATPPSISPTGNAPTTVNNAAVNASALPSEASPGPYETDRRNVRNWLLEARKRGVGLGAYMPVWDDMESTVKSGGSDVAVKTKLDTICRNIGEQVKNSSSIQRFRPVKPKKSAQDEDVEVIKVKWIGPKGSDPLFRDKADKWYNDVRDLLTPEQRADREVQRKLHDQRDMIFKEMHDRWATEKNWAPRVYKNINQDMFINENNGPNPSQRGYAPPSFVPDPTKWSPDTTPTKNKH